jgi:arylsulfatase A-like enzyme
MVWTFLTRTLWLLVLLAILAATACRQNEPLPISLMDQVDPAEPLGPWRLVTEVDSLQAWADGAQGLGIPVKGELIDVSSLASLSRGQLKHASRVMEKGGAFVQTEPISAHRWPVTARPGERLLLGLRYGADWVEAPLVELRLLRAGEVVASVEADVGGHWSEAQITVPPEGADALEIRHHLEPGMAIPLKLAIILVVDHTAPDEDVARARLFLRLARSPRAFPIARVCERRLFPLELDGRTLDTLLLSSGETREMAVPPGLAGRRLLCWATVLDGRLNISSTLTLEAEAGATWHTLTALPVRAGDAGTWSEISLGDEAGLPPDCGRIRLTLNGGDTIVGVSGPVFPAGQRPSKRKNLLVIDLDTLRADRLGTYGYRDQPTTGRLDALLGQWGWHLFEHAYTPAAYTLPATAKFLAGRYHDIQQKEIIPREYKMLPEMLREAGYYCAAFTGGGQLRHKGFEQGFHEYFWSKDVGKIEDSFPQAKAWIRDNAGELFFLFLHTYETHAPYTRGEFCSGLSRGRLGDVNRGELLIPAKSGIRNNTPLTEPEKQYVNAAYDGGVKRAADEVADLLVELDRLGLADDTVVVILSDHGEEFWDHNELFARHGQSLYGELLNVPLIVFDPDRPADGLHCIAEAVSTVDLVPTVLDLLGLPLTTEVDGVSLMPLIEGMEPGETLQREIPVLASRLDKAYCVIHEGVKYIRDLGPRPWLARQDELNTPPGELFRLDDDPREQQNLALLQPELERRMLALLRQAAQLALPPREEDSLDYGPVSPDLDRQLRALGYVAGK